MHKLNDTQRVLLATAAQREDHSLLPLPEGMRMGPRTTKAITGLLGAELATEGPTTAGPQSYREADHAHIGVFATQAGLTAIGVVGDEGGDQQPDTLPSPSTPAARVSKSAAIVALMHRADGATLPELIAATGWLPHTTRAALTGLRKKGHMIERSARDGAACYRIVEAA